MVTTLSVMAGRNMAETTRHSVARRGLASADAGSQGEDHSGGARRKLTPPVGCQPFRCPLSWRQLVQEDQIRDVLNAHWHASAIGDEVAEHDIYADDAVCEYPQSGERIVGRVNLQALRSHHPGKPSGFNIRRILGKGDLWITEYIITYQGRPTYTVSIMEFRDGKVMHETQYFADPFEAPNWRSQWVQRTS